MSERPPRIERITPHTFVIIGHEGATNFGIIRGTDGTGCLLDADIRRVDEIEESLRQARCDRIRYLFNTHENFDHSSANDYFEKNHALVISSDGCLEALREDGEAKFAEMSGRTPELHARFPGLRMGLPGVTFETAGTVLLPGVTTRLEYCGWSHSRGDSVAVVEDEGILFAGDLLYHQVHPVTIYGDIPRWIESLGRLRERPFEHIVPGHGPRPIGREAGRKALDTFRLYLEDFHAQLLEARAGRRSASDVEKHMVSGAYEELGKSYMVKRNTTHFLRAGQ